VSVRHLPGEALLGRDFRANPRYELALFDRLTEEERRRLAELRRDPGFYGLLRPRGGAPLAVKSVDRDTALLFLTLRDPGPLPGYLHDALGAGVARLAAQLVADGILEVASGGSFVSGAAAWDLFDIAGGDPGERRQGRLAALAAAALRHAAALPLADPGALAARLYGYNRRPLTPLWRRRLPTAAAIRDFLGIAPGGPSHALLDSGWREGEPGEGWLHWSARRRVEGGLPAHAAVYKLYLSPEPEHLAAAFGRLLAALPRAHAFQVKVGADAWGLLRPDKVVVYFPSFERLSELAFALAENLAGIPAHGVPFTSEIAGGGLLSWGVDPPGWVLPGGGRESWRGWLVRRLARALLDAREAGEERPWELACARLRLEGVETGSWTPGSLLFARFGAE
jgi:hypothetical protein